MGVAFFSGQSAMRAGKLATHIPASTLVLCVCISLSQNAAADQRRNNSALQPTPPPPQAD
jgi:hypothetical protein